VITQSIAFLYAPEGERVKDEEARAFEDAPQPFGTAVAATLEGERLFLESGMEGVVLRYGWFYGPATYYAYDGNIVDDVRRRRFPIVGQGTGVFSYVHVEDAAAATVAAVEGGEPGVYNVVDDDPAPMRDWLPYYAHTIGAKRPFRVPAWLARRVAGAFTTSMATELRGASNAKAKRELGWEPTYPSWRQGFREALG
jgi:nucleoside-diphosphate-sugar epimerase